MKPTQMTFFIHGDPKGQPRPRAFARKMGAKYVARMYDSDVADDWKRAVNVALVKAINEQKPEYNKDGAFEVVATFWMRRPKSHFNAHGFVKLGSSVRHAQKPDADNMVKLILDRVTRTKAIWRDDSQVAYMTVAKYWAESEQNVGCNFTLQLFSTS